MDTNNYGVDIHEPKWDVDMANLPKNVLEFDITCTVCGKVYGVKRKR